MNKKPVNQRRSYSQRRIDALNSLPLHDVKSLEDAHIYTSMSEDELSKLPNFNEDGTIKLFQVGDVLLGKLSLIEFVKTIKNK